jgi:hypothetical protein
MMKTTTTTTCDESTALLRDPSAKTARRGVTTRVGLALGLCAAIALAWATATTEDADPNAPTVAAPRFWATVDVGDGRELSARAYAAFLKRRLAEDALSEDGLMKRAELGNETLAEDEDAEDEDAEDEDVEDEDVEDEDVEDEDVEDGDVEDEDVENAELGSRENSPEMQTLDPNRGRRVRRAPTRGERARGVEVYQAEHQGRQGLGWSRRLFSR